MHIGPMLAALRSQSQSPCRCGDRVPGDGGPPRRVALLAAIEGPIGPATVRHVEKVIETAAERDAEVLILRLDTPGGLVDSMREIIVAILASRTPVVGFVAPPVPRRQRRDLHPLCDPCGGDGAGHQSRRRDAGADRRLPGLPAPQDEARRIETRGATSRARRKGSRGEDRNRRRPPPPLADAMSAKATNDAVAFIRSLAEMRGRNADWAEQAVREAASLSATRRGRETSSTWWPTTPRRCSRPRRPEVERAASERTLADGRPRDRADQGGRDDPGAGRDHRTPTSPSC